MLTKIFDWLIPTTCLACSLKSNQAFCADCLLELPWLKTSCHKCATEIAISHLTYRYCGECLLDPPPINYVLVLFNYTFPINSFITQLKFNRKLSYAQALGSLLAEKIAQVYQREQLPLPQGIIPMPLHPKRLYIRGYNQALELARPIKNRLQLPIDWQKVSRTKLTIPQTLVTANLRAENVQNTFKVATNLAWQHVAIVDDVVTTFSSIKALIKPLQQQGVSKIDVWCVAKACT